MGQICDRVRVGQICGQPGVKGGGSGVAVVCVGGRQICGQPGVKERLHDSGVAFNALQSMMTCSLEPTQSVATQVVPREAPLTSPPRESPLKEPTQSVATQVGATSDIGHSTFRGRF